MSKRDDFWGWTSGVESANDPAVGLPLQSLPYCAFRSSETAGDDARLGVGIGSFVVDLRALDGAGLLAALSEDVREACAAPALNPLLRCGRQAWTALRRALIDLLRSDANAEVRDGIERCLIARENVVFLKPVAVGDYTDFYASLHHATNVGKLFRPDQPLLPNYKWLPVGYHGRASSLLISGTGIRRPRGQAMLAGEEAPRFGPSAQLDYELEVAAYIGAGNALGEPIALGQAEGHIFGVSLLNDWSARDIQAWEYQPLGPFLGKSFATSVSPWVVPMEALEPYRVPLAARAESDPAPLRYLADASNEEAGSIDMKLEVWLQTARMREAWLDPVRLSAANLRDLYWTFAQMIAHHTSNGCNLVEGDLIASGTVSGPAEGSQGCLLEMTRRGASPIRLPNGEKRAFLEDGDEVILRGFCEKDDFPRMCIGECRGTILAAHGEDLTAV